MNEIGGSESKYCVKVDAYENSCEIFIYNIDAQLFAIERNGSYGNAGLKLNKFLLIKISI